jgi:acetylornithine deacetylase/succinyl-diaminopimelate desuccinylase
MKNTELEKLIKKIDENEVIDILKKLISVLGHINYPGQEKKISDCTLKIIKKEGIETYFQEVENGRNNVIAKIPGKKNGKSLALNGHLDTVPPNDNMKSYEPLIKDKKVFGLGAVDMKGGVTAMMYSMFLLNRENVHLDGDLFFTGVIGEESGGTGTRFLMDKGFKSDYFLVGEPTDLNIVNSHKGCFQMDITITGKAAHGSIPEKGANAISAMASFITKLNNEYIPILNSRYQEGVGKPTINYGIIKGGKKVNIVADKCTLTIDRRWIDSEKNTDFIYEIEPYLTEVCNTNPEFKYEATSTLPEGGYFGPLFLPKNHKFIDIVKSAIKGIGLNTKVVGMQGWTDGATILNKGFPTLVIGPGSMSKAHSKDEFICIKDIIEAIKIYLSIAIKICKN